jgi:hypothetical protein
MREDDFPKAQLPIAPASLMWQDNGELAPQEVFNLICHLRKVESQNHSNELWRLGQKYPAEPRRSS